MGLSCEGFEDDDFVLTIEAIQHQNGLASSPSSLFKSVTRGCCELKRVASSNYDLKGGLSSIGKGKGKGRGHSCS